MGTQDGYRCNVAADSFAAIILASAAFSTGSTRIVSTRRRKTTEGTSSSVRNVPLMHWRLLSVSTCLCLGGSLNFGIQLTVLNPSESVFRQFINVSHHQHYGSYLTGNSYQILWSFILTALLIGNIIGILTLVKFSETLGRLKTFYVSAGFTIGGLICQFLSKIASAYELLAFGRFIAGIGLGIALPLQSMYFNEVSPVECRGLLCGMTGVFLEMGLVLGGVLALPATLGSENLWMYIFVVQAGTVVMSHLILPFLHESPRYLVSRQKLDAARKSLEFFGHTDISATIQEIETEIRHSKNQVTWRELWKKVHLRRALSLSILQTLATSFSGIVVIDFFTTKLLIDVGLPIETAQYASIGIFSGTLVSSVFGQMLVDRIGRKPLLLTTILALILVNACLMTFSILSSQYSHASWTGMASIVACVALTLAYGFGPAILYWIVAAELVPQNARSRVQLVTSLVLKLVNTSVGFIFLPLQGTTGPFAFLIFIVPLCVIFVIFFFKFPETKRKTVLEIMNELGFEEEGVYLLSGT